MPYMVMVSTLQSRKAERCICVALNQIVDISEGGRETNPHTVAYTEMYCITLPTCYIHVTRQDSKLTSVISKGSDEWYTEDAPGKNGK